MLNSDDIKKIIPHRYPFLLVDRVLEMEPLKKIIAIKNVSANEMYFMGHFPQEQVMPGVLIVEALAQAGAVMLLSEPEHQGKIAYFAGIDNCRFKRKVIPGDTLTLEVEVIKFRGPIGKAQGKATVNGELAASAEITFAVGQ